MVVIPCTVFIQASTHSREYIHLSNARNQSTTSTLLCLSTLVEIDALLCLGSAGVSRSVGRRLWAGSVERDSLGYESVEVRSRDSPISVKTSPTFAPVLALASKKSRPHSLAYASASSRDTCLALSSALLGPDGVADVWEASSSSAASVGPSSVAGEASSLEGESTRSSYRVSLPQLV